MAVDFEFIWVQLSYKQSVLTLRVCLRVYYIFKTVAIYYSLLENAVGQKPVKSNKTKTTSWEFLVEEKTNNGLFLNNFALLKGWTHPNMIKTHPAN